MPNVDLKPYCKPSMWRKMSFANWTHPTNPQVYGRLELDMTGAIAYAKKLTDETGIKVTATHIIVRAVAVALKAHPQANSIIRFFKVYERKHVNIFCQVAIPGEKPDLSGVVIRDADRKSPVEIATDLRARAEKVRSGQDKELEQTRQSLDLIPTSISRLVLETIGLLQYTLNLDMRPVGLPKDAFGGVMVTSIGSLGISEAYPPLVPMSRVPLVVAIGKVTDRPVAMDGEVVIRPICVLTTTFDHRIMDGILAGKLARTVTEYIEDPEATEGKLG